MVSEGSLLNRWAEDTASLTWLQALHMLREAPGVTSAPPWAVEGPGNLSWSSSCQPWCFTAAVCHPGGWDLLKGNHVNLYVTTQSAAEWWCWQVKSVEGTKSWGHHLRTEMQWGPLFFVLFPFFSFFFIFASPFSSILMTWAKAYYRTCLQSWSSRINLLPSEFFP